MTVAGFGERTVIDCVIRCEARQPIITRKKFRCRVGKKKRLPNSARVALTWEMEGLPYERIGQKDSGLGANTAVLFIREFFPESFKLKIKT